MERNDSPSRFRFAGRYALELEAVGRRFGALVALADVNLAVKAGERRAILGSNGAGKTTLFNLVTGDFPVTAGRIRFFGEDITALPVQERIRRGLRRTYQISLLFENLSVGDNLFVACRGVMPRRASLRRARASDPAVRMAETLADAMQLDGVLDVPAGRLGHGQQRQLELGIALAGAPRLLLLDEPAAGLSPGERKEFMAILGSLPAHIGYVIIEHDMDVALGIVESVSMMHNGRIFKEGTPDEMEKDPEVQALYLGEKHG